ncbi:hypothetical protein ACZ91_64835 [Streptomyces regensis]|nr:hypothetical protein ACZ91_64835 [Streptomyces regensis]
MTTTTAVSYFFESRPRSTRDLPWQRSASLRWQALDRAELYLAGRRRDQSSWEHRLITRTTTTTITEEPTP